MSFRFGLECRVVGMEGSNHVSDRKAHSDIKIEGGKESCLGMDHIYSLIQVAFTFGADSNR